jgi:hypothetical protein
MTACDGPSTMAEAPRATTEPTGATMSDGDYPMLLGMIARGGSTIGWVIAPSTAVRTEPAGSRPAGAGRMGGGAQMTFTHSGSRYLFGTTFDPEGSAI